MKTYELAQPWIVWTYRRPDWIAALIGARIEGECCICAARCTVRFPPWRFWRRRPIDRGPAPGRVRFRESHQHPRQARNRLSWAKPLGGAGLTARGSAELMREGEAH